MFKWSFGPLMELIVGAVQELGMERSHSLSSWLGSRQGVSTLALLRLKMEVETRPV